MHDLTYGFTGWHSTIAQEMMGMYDNSGKKLQSQEIQYSRHPRELSLKHDRYVFCSGFLAGENLDSISNEQILETITANLVAIGSFCDNLFDVNEKARVCIIGSMSGYNGSFDLVYAAAKAGIHLYVEKKELSEATQHIVAVAPTIIEDSGMTRRRDDIRAVRERGGNRRLGRWLTAEEVARTALFALENDAMCNTVVKLTGGNK